MYSSSTNYETENVLSFLKGLEVADANQDLYFPTLDEFSQISIMVMVFDSISLISLVFAIICCHQKRLLEQLPKSIQKVEEFFLINFVLQFFYTCSSMILHCTGTRLCETESIIVSNGDLNDYCRAGEELKHFRFLVMIRYSIRMFLVAWPVFLGFYALRMVNKQIQFKTITFAYGPYPKLICIVVGIGGVLYSLSRFYLCNGTEFRNTVEQIYLPLCLFITTVEFALIYYSARQRVALFSRDTAIGIEKSRLEGLRKAGGFMVYAYILLLYAINRSYSNLKKEFSWEVQATLIWMHYFMLR